MRPVDRGPWPLDDQGHAKTFHPYNKAKWDLLNRLGEYCSYCERTGDLHVEHVVPRNRRSDLAEEWTNLLLGCTNCNSTKRCRNASRDGFIWPDEDDTLVAFEYLPDGIVRVRGSVVGPAREKAQALFDLVGLGRRPGNDPKARDLRWRKRREAWGQAEEARERIENGGDVEWVVDLARAVGFWAVWMTVFADDPVVTGRLREAFPGTR